MALRLGFQWNTLIRLLVCWYSNVADCVASVILFKPVFFVWHKCTSFILLLMSVKRAKRIDPNINIRVIGVRAWTMLDVLNRNGLEQPSVVFQITIWPVINDGRIPALNVLRQHVGLISHNLRMCKPFVRFCYADHCESHHSPKLFANDLICSACSGFTQIFNSLKPAAIFLFRKLATRSRFICALSVIFNPWLWIVHYT